MGAGRSARESQGVARFARSSRKEGQPSRSQVGRHRTDQRQPAICGFARREFQSSRSVTGGPARCLPGSREFAGLLPGGSEPGRRESGRRFARKRHGPCAAAIGRNELARRVRAGAYLAIRCAGGIFASLASFGAYVRGGNFGELSFMADDLEDEGRSTGDGFGDYSLPAFLGCRSCAPHGGNLLDRAGAAALCLLAFSISLAAFVGRCARVACRISRWPHSGRKTASNHYRTFAVTFPLDEPGSSLHAANREKRFGVTGVLDRSSGADSFLGTLSDAARNSWHDSARAFGYDRRWHSYLHNDPNRTASGAMDHIREK